MSSCLSSAALRLISPKYPSNRRRLLLAPSSPSSLILSSPISFQRLSALSPIRAQQQQQDHPPPPPPEAAEPPAEGAVDPSLLPQALRDIIALFQSVPDPKAKYHQLLHYSRHLPPFDLRFKTDEHRVRGCVSQVWVRAFPDPADPAAVRFEADSDSALTKGLAALLVLGLSGSPAPDIARVPPEFVHLLGLRQSLTPSRNNGFLNMLRLMQHKALQLYGADANIASEVEVARDSPNEVDSNDLATIDLSPPVVVVADDVTEAISDEVLEAPPVVVVADDVTEAISDEVMEEEASSSGGRAERMRERLERELSPVELVIEDISHQHAGHAGVRGSSSGETHFNLRVVSKEFEGKSLVKRHRLVYGLLQEELQSGLHALSIDAKTPSEVQLS